jgi:hypothetical protein
MNFLQKALTSNAIFSAISGLILILFHKPIAQVFAMDNTTLFWVLGIALLYFAVTIWYESKKQRPTFVQWIIFQDMVWVVGSAYLLWVQPFGISKMGNILIGVVADIVLLFAVLQYLGLKKSAISPKNIKV